MRLVSRAVDILRDGGIVVHPTDTTYALGVALSNKRGIEKLYQIKKKSLKRPLSFICKDLSHISEYGDVSKEAYRTMKRLLPGPYTFILQASRLVPKIILPKRQTTGIRVPDSRICLALVRELGKPVISTSVKTEDGEILSDPRDIEDKFGRRVDLVIDSGVMLSGQSSVISLVDDVIEVIRVGQGDVSAFI